MSAQIITLMGGPADGTQWLWPEDGADDLAWLGHPGELSAELQGGRRDTAHPVRSIYLRSIVTRSIFVWQP